VLKLSPFFVKYITIWTSLCPAAISFVRPDWPARPADTRFAPLILASIPFILIAAFVMVAFVGWNLGVFGR
jgi:hypothetical protein